MQSQRVFELIAKAPFVSIAVVEGAAVAGGFEWALACDVRIVGPGARFWLPETALGLVPAAGGCTRLTELIGASKAKQVILFHERVHAERAVEWGIAQTLSDTPLRDALELAQSLGGEQLLARTLAKTLIDARGGGGGGGHEESLRNERIAEGLLYEAKYRPRAVICGIGTAAPEERYTQQAVADLLKVNDPRMRTIYSSAHIESRRLAEIGTEAERGTTQGQLLNKHLRWAKKLAAVAIPSACEASGIELNDVCFLVVCTTTGFLSPGLSAHVANHLRLPASIQRADIVGMGCHAGLNAMAAAAHWAEAHPGKPALMFACEVVSAAYQWDSAKPDIAVALTNSLFGDGSAAAVLIAPSPTRPIIATPDQPRPMLYGFESLLLPDSLDSLCYNWLDDYHKFSFTISPQVPYLMGLKIPGMVQRLLEQVRATFPRPPLLHPSLTFSHILSHSLPPRAASSQARGRRPLGCPLGRQKGARPRLIRTRRPCHLTLCTRATLSSHCGASAHGLCGWCTGPRLCHVLARPLEARDTPLAQLAACNGQHVERLLPLGVRLAPPREGGQERRVRRLHHHGPRRRCRVRALALHVMGE